MCTEAMVGDVTAEKFGYAAEYDQDEVCWKLTKHEQRKTESGSESDCSDHR